MSHRTEPDSLPSFRAGREPLTDAIGTQRWGYLSRATGRYGSVTTHLVVYPPDSAAGERLWADTSRTVISLGIGGSVIAVIVLLGTGVPPGLSLLLIAGLFAAGWAILASQTTRVRRGSASAWECTSAISPDPDCSRAQTRLTELADTMADAARARHDGRMSAEAYAQTWHTVFAEVADLGRRRSR